MKRKRRSGTPGVDALCQANNNQAIVDAIALLQQTIERHSARSEALAFNSSAYLDTDSVRPPPVVVAVVLESYGNNPIIIPPIDFPTTVRGVKDLEVSPLLTNIETFYGLPHTSSIAVRNRRVRRAYGIGITSISIE